MNAPYQADPELEKRLSGRLLDVFIRAGAIFALAVLCYNIFAPFISLMAWALILAVALYPLHQKLARKMGAKQGRAATLLVLGAIVLIVAPITVLTLRLGDSVHNLVGGLHDNTLQIPAPPPSIASWPLVGKKVHDFWSLAHEDLPAFVRSLQPQIGDLSKKAVAMVSSIGVTVLLFLVSIIVAGIIMAFGQAGARSAGSIFDRFVGSRRGETFAALCTATIRAVALGILGVAVIQAIVVGLILLIAGVPFASGARSAGAGAGDSADSSAPNHLASYRIPLARRALRYRGRRNLHCAAGPRWHARQRAQTAIAGSRCRRADARDLAGRIGRACERRDSGNVRWRDFAGFGLPDLHEVGGHQSGHPRTGEDRIQGCRWTRRAIGP